jgi:hypothetical protein
MLDLTALLTKDSIEPLALPGMRADGTNVPPPFAPLTVPIPGALAAARAMIHRNARRCSAPCSEQDGGSVMDAGTGAIDCHALRSRLPKRASVPVWTCSG